MTLLPNWKRIARKAWSVRLMAAASVLTGCEAVLPYVESSITRGSFALLSFIIVTAALLARFIVQKDMSDE